MSVAVDVASVCDVCSFCVEVGVGVGGDEASAGVAIVVSVVGVRVVERRVAVAVVNVDVAVVSECGSCTEVGVGVVVAVAVAVGADGVKELDDVEQLVDVLDSVVVGQGSCRSRSRSTSKYNSMSAVVSWS